jgi:hypothetical protein
VQRLPAQKGSSKFARQLPEDDYWGLVVPAWSDSQLSEPGAKACNGEAVVLSPEFESARVDPEAKSQGKITYGGGANRIRVVWLRSHITPDGDSVGPLALLRVSGDYVEVYGVRAFRGNAESTRFDLERIGGEVVVTAVSDGCKQSAQDCDSTLQVFRPVHGRLDSLAEMGLQRVRFREGLEPGMNGVVKYQLTTSPEYRADGIHVVEDVEVTDAVGRKLRRAQLERAFLLSGARVRETKESLWTRLFAERDDPGAEAP